MKSGNFSSWMLEQEARSLLTRLNAVKPFVLYETMVPAAMVSVQALTAIERYVGMKTAELRRLANQFFSWLHLPEDSFPNPEVAQRRFTFIKLRFNSILNQVDIFADVLTQRSENKMGVWLAGLDVVAEDAMSIPDQPYHAPPVMCYVDRGHGAAIRRARTRLPGGGENPTAIIRVPRERMVGYGIASSLIHEVGHQTQVLLGLENSLRGVVHSLPKSTRHKNDVWAIYDRWLSEILSDFWSVGKVGVVSTLGLMGVVSLPKFFVLRFNAADPHPIPWIRVKLSCMIGSILYPHPQWERLARLWESYYPLNDLTEDKRMLIAELESVMPQFVQLMLDHHPPSLSGRSLRDIMMPESRHPARLIKLFHHWQSHRREMLRHAPTLALAVIGQARANGLLTPEQESALVSNLLMYWAKSRTLKTTAQCAAMSELDLVPTKPVYSTATN